MRIDLHMHSTASDGALPPADVVEQARTGGLDLIALADHDTVAGVPAAVEAAAGSPRVIPAIEISASHGERDLHILGYGIDHADETMVAYSRRAGQAREVRIREMIDRLAGLDIDVDFETVVAEAGPGAHSLARPHLARVLWHGGHVGSVAEAFDRYIGDAGPAFVPIQLMDAGAAIASIHSAGGVAVWAHPAPAAVDADLPGLVDLGLDGVECYRPRATRQEIDRLLAIARRHDLLVTGGSDWHGPWHGDLGTFTVDERRVAAFLERLGPPGQDAL